MRFLSLISILGVVSAIYPEDHWKFSQQLTTNTFDSAIKAAVDADKTMFRYANHQSVTFGDVNLSEENIRGNHQPGAGGWPTIRYFNKQTGYEGANYVKKTSKSMCDELGDETMMEEYVVEAAGLNSCNFQSGEGCSEKEIEFITKWKSQDYQSLVKEKLRLEGVKTNQLKADLATWLKQRLSILKQILAQHSSAEL